MSVVAPDGESGIYKLLKNQVVIITGVGRSGTTILGKVVGSMTPCFYVFEPAIFKYIGEFPYSDTFGRIVFEDYFSPIMQGRGNMNPSDWSCMTNYEGLANIKDRRNTLPRRSDLISYVKRVYPLFIVKSNEFQHLAEYARWHFWGVRFIHILRNGFDVVNSSLSRGWFTDTYCNEDIIEQAFSGPVRIPCFITDNDDQLSWAKWNPATRAACSWRHLTEQGLEYKRQNKDDTIQFKYESFCSNPVRYAEYISGQLGLKLTELTMHHVNSVRKPNKSNTVPNILEPEFTKFKRLNERLGYC